MPTIVYEDKENGEKITFDIKVTKQMVLSGSTQEVSSGINIIFEGVKAEDGPTNAVGAMLAASVVEGIHKLKYGHVKKAPLIKTKTPTIN